MSSSSMEERTRRDSTLSFQSCQKTESEGEETQPVAVKDEPAVSPQEYHDMRVHALLEYILDIRWTYSASSPAQSDHAKAFAENLVSRSLDSLREGRSPTCEWPAKKGRRFSQLHPDANVTPISLILEPDQSPSSCRRWLTFDNVPEIITYLVSNILARNRLNLITSLAMIWFRASKHCLNKHVACERILKKVPDIDTQLLDLQDCILNNANLPLICPDFYANVAPMTEDEYGAALYATALCPAGPVFLPRFFEALAAEGRQEGVAANLLDKIFVELAGRRLLDLRTQAVTVLNLAIGISCLVKELVNRPYWLPDPRDASPGWTLMRSTLLGRLFQATPLDSVLQGDERPGFVSAVDKYIKPLIGPGGTGAHNTLSVQQIVRNAHTGVVKSLAELIKSLVREGGQVREKTLQWFGAAIEANKAQASLQHLHMQQALAGLARPMEGLVYSTRGLSLNGFGFNVCWVLLELCQPISLEKIERLIDPLWPLSCCETEDGYLLGSSVKGESTFIEDEAYTKKAKAMFTSAREAKFTSQVFWLTLKSVRVFLFQCVADNELRQQLLGKIVRGAPEPPGVTRSSLIVDCLTWNTILMNEPFINTYTHMVELVSAVLLHAAFKFDANGQPYTAKGDLLCKNALLRQLNVTTSMIPDCNEPSPQFALLPSSYFSDFYETFSKFIFAAASPLFTAQPEVNSVLENSMHESNCEVYAASLVFILRDAGTFIRNAGFKAEAAGHNLTAISVTKRLADRMAQTTAHQNALAGAIIVSFTQAQKLSYYLRIDMRLILTRELQRNLDGRTFKQQMDQLSRSDPSSYEKFLHFFASNTSWVLEEALTLLSEIKRKEGGAAENPAAQVSATDALRDRQRGRAAQTNDAEREEAEASRLAEELEGTRNVAEMPLDDLISQCKSLMEAGSISLDAFSRFDTRAFRFILQSEVLLPQVVLYLNSCLSSLVGPKCLNLKVSNFEIYNFKPREFLAFLCRIYVGLMKEDEDGRLLFDAVTKEERYFKPELFTKAVHIVRREGLLDAKTFSDFSNFSVALSERFKHNQSVEALIVHSAPDEFMDPILSELMTDPVKLPSSGVIVDRKTIERHLISEEFDPFNRAPLKKEDLIPQTELKTKIHDFLRDATGAEKG